MCSYGKKGRASNVVGLGRRVDHLSCVAGKKRSVNGVELGRMVGQLVCAELEIIVFS